MILDDNNDEFLYSPLLIYSDFINLESVFNIITELV